MGEDSMSMTTAISGYFFVYTKTVGDLCLTAISLGKEALDRKQ
jgi:hypothetical protein